MLLPSAYYQEFLTDIIEMQSQYYVPLIFVGLIVVASVLMYKKTNNKSSNPSNPSTHNPSNHNNTSSSSSSLSHSSFSSSFSMNETKPNQKYRKQDPNTRYDDDGTRYQCVAVPYRIINNSKVEVFMITSRNRGDYIFPGGGWEKHESRPQCAQREAWEEAGVRGDIIKEIVSDQQYTSEKGNKSRLWGYLLNVTQVLDEWPEIERHRKWMTINEAEIAVSPKRRAKFGNLWKNAVQYFIEQNLYHLPFKSDENKNKNKKSNKNKHSEGYDHRKNNLNKINITKS